jgi:hypothetical protein
MDAGTRSRTISEAARDWAQVVALLLAGVWAVYTFSVQEHLRRTAPISVTADVDVKNVGTSVVGDQQLRLTALEVTITAANPSTRPVFLLPSFWVASGIRIGPPESARAWRQSVSQNVERRTTTEAGAYYDIAQREIAAANSVLAATALQPGERVARVAVFYVPADTFDMTEIEVAFIVSAEPRDEVFLDYDFSRVGMSASMFKIGKDGKRVELTA